MVVGTTSVFIYKWTDKGGCQYCNKKKIAEIEMK